MMALVALVIGILLFPGFCRTLLGMADDNTHRGDAARKDGTENGNR